MEREHFVTLPDGQRVRLTKLHDEEFMNTWRGLAVALGIMLLGFGVFAAIMACL